MSMASKDEWLYFIEEEEGEMFALEVVDDIILNSQRVLFEKQIDTQILPYTVDFADQVLSDMINFYYYQRDPGNVDATLWIPDEEPEGVRIDSWASAAVPIKKLSKPVKPVTQPKDEVVSQKDDYIRIPTPKKEKKINQVPPVIKKAQYVTIPVIPKKPKTSSPSLKIQDSTKKKSPSSLSKQGMADSSPVGIEAEKSIAEENKKFLSRLANAAENSKIDYTYDQNGRIIPLNTTPSWNPIQEIKYKITGASNSNPMDRNSISTSSAIFKKGNKVSRASTTQPSQPSQKKSKVKQVSESKFDKDDDFTGFQDDPKLGIPLLADTMKIVPGVTLREGEVVKTAPELHNAVRSTLSTGSKDITQEKGVFQTSQIMLLEEIIAHSKPVTANPT